jgi:hypothetical protein
MVISDMLRECEFVVARGWRREHSPEGNEDAHESEDDTQPRHDVGLDTLVARDLLSRWCLCVCVRVGLQVLL